MGLELISVKSRFSAKVAISPAAFVLFFFLALLCCCIRVSHKRLSLSLSQTHTQHSLRDVLSLCLPLSASLSLGTNEATRLALLSTSITVVHHFYTQVLVSHDRKPFFFSRSCYCRWKAACRMLLQFSALPRLREISGPLLLLVPTYLHPFNGSLSTG